MAYTSATLSKVVGTIAGTFNIWDYVTTDAANVVDAAGYVTDARKRGLIKGDVVYVRNVAATPPTVQMMIVANVAANGSGDLSDGTAIAATNTD